MTHNIEAIEQPKNGLVKIKCPKCDWGRTGLSGESIYCPRHGLVIAVEEKEGEK